MVAYRRQLKDKDGNVIYPDTGIDLDNVVFSDTPGEVIPPVPWVKPSDIDLQYMTAYGTAGDTVYGSAGTITLNAEVHNGPFSLSNNAIVIGSGVSRVMVSANAFWSSNGSAFGWCAIYKNGANLTPQACAIANITGSSFGSSVITPVVIDVVPGDKITLYNLQQNVKLRGYNTWLTVIAVG